MKRAFWMFCLLAVLLSGMAGAFRQIKTHKQQEIFPGKHVYLFTFDDRESGGSSRIVSLERHLGGATMAFLFGQNTVSWIGIGGTLETGGRKGFDLTQWDSIEFDMSTNRAIGANCGLVTFDSSIWRHGDYLSRRYLESPLETIQPGLHRIALDDFRLAPWWKARGYAKPSDTTRRLDQTVQFQVSLVLAGSKPTGSPDTLLLHRIQVVSDRSIIGLWVWVFPALAGVAALASLFRKSVRSTTPLPSLQVSSPPRLVAQESRPVERAPEPRSLELDNEKTALRKRLIGFLATNYSRSDLDADTVCKESSIPRSRLPEIVRDLDTSFKELLNGMRLKEAARLLRETENPVSEIAFAVGYGSIPHFNRVFRDCYGCPPVAYRTKPNGETPPREIDTPPPGP